MDTSQRHFAVILLVLVGAILALIAFRASSPPKNVGTLTPLAEDKEGQRGPAVLTVGAMALTLPASYTQLFKEPFHGLVSYRFRGPSRRSLTVKHYKSGRQAMQSLYDELAENPRDARRKTYLGKGKVLLETNLGNETVSGRQFVIDEGASREWLLVFFPRATGEDFFELRFLTDCSKEASDEVKGILRGLLFDPGPAN